MSGRFDYPEDREARSAARVRALEALLIEKGVITGETVDRVMAVFATEMGPFNGARLVARAWLDSAFKQLLVTDTMAAVTRMGFPTGAAGAEGEHMRAVANTPEVHNLIICTLCSCYPWPVLGLPPYWYKDPSFRARAAREPRKVLGEFGVHLPPDKEIRTWDSSAQIRWFVIPERPAGTDSLTEDQLAALVTPEAMMGVALVPAPAALSRRAMQTRYEHFAVASMLGQPDAPPRRNGGFCFAQPWERQAFGLALALARDGHFEWEEFRQGLIEEIRAWEDAHGPTDPTWNYYERWLAVLERVVRRHGLGDPAGTAEPGQAAG